MSNDDRQAPSKDQFLVCQTKEGELEPVRTIKTFLTARQEGKLV